jgi:hypothetical protein
MTKPRALPWLAKDRETDWRFTWLLCIPYLAFLIWMQAHHEMWRDEIHPWTLARLANGFSDLVTGDRLYEGHPPLWFWYLHVWTWFVKAAWGIQAATIAAATAAAAILVRFAPFPRYLKVLLLFSYFFGYEYTVMSRNYVLGWLLVCIVCALDHRVRTRYLALAVALGLLALTSFYGLVMCIFLLGYFLLGQTRLALESPNNRPPRVLALSLPPRALATVAIVGAAILFCLATIEPPDPNPYSPGFEWNQAKVSAIPRMLFRVTTGIVPWAPGWNPEFWWGTQVFWENNLLLAAGVGTALLVLALVALYPSWRLALVYAAATVTMAMFQQVRHEGCTRHWGHYFMFLVVCAWLARNALPHRRHLPATLLLSAIVLGQAPTLIAATVVDTRGPFSGGRETAAFIEQAGLQDLPIVAGPDFAMVTVAGFLRKPFFAHETDEINETVVFHGHHKPFSSDELMNKAIAVSREKKSPVLLVCTRQLPDPPARTTRTLLFTSRPKPVVSDEVFSVYRLETF